MKKLYCLLLPAVLACSKKDHSDTLPLPVQQLVDEASCVCTTSIDKYLWRSKIIYVAGSQPNCNSIGLYYDAQGKSLGEVLAPDYPTFQDFLKEAKHLKNYFACQ